MRHLYTKARSCPFAEAGQTVDDVIEGGTWGEGSSALVAAVLGSRPPKRCALCNSIGNANSNE